MYNHPLILSESSGMTKQALFQFLLPAAAVTGKILGALGTVAGAAWLYKKLADILFAWVETDPVRLQKVLSGKSVANAPKPQNFAKGYLPGIMSGIGINTEAEKRYLLFRILVDKYKALANAPKPQNFAQGYLPGIMSGIGINTEAEKRVIDKYKALANAPKPQNFAQGYLPGIMSGIGINTENAPKPQNFAQGYSPGIMSGIGINTEAEKRVIDKYKALYRAKTTKGFTQGYLPGFELPKAMVPKGKGIGFWGPFSGALMAWFLWPHIKEFAYGIGLGQPITAAQQRLSGKPIDWGTLRDPAVEHYFDTQYRMINPQF